MFGYLKNLLGKSDAKRAPIQKGPPKNGVSGSTRSTNTKSFPRPVSRPTPRPVTHANANLKAGAHANGRSNASGVHIPLQPVLSGLPVECQKKVRQSSVGEMTISLPFDRILSQLNTGVVKISFGELRKAASGAFTSASDCDQVDVVLPLG